MKYFIYNDKNYIDKMNMRGFPLGSVTKQWVNVKKHPVEEKWAAEIPEELLNGLGKLLTEEEINVIQGNLFDSLTEDWEI